MRVTMMGLQRTMVFMTNRQRNKTLQIVAAAALSLTVLGAGASYAMAVDPRGAKTAAQAGTIYSDVGTSYGSYDFSGSTEREVPVWKGEIG